MNSSFQPISHYSKNSFINFVLLKLRLFLDFQFRTIYCDVKRELQNFKGKTLDVGCGNSPFIHLLKKDSDYTGLDYVNASQFNYNRTDIVYYDGEIFPFTNDLFDNVICTEVIEHIAEPKDFIREIHRVLTPNGKAIITIPWSARYHFIPNDYYRFTPIALEKLFGDFSKVTVTSRGTDLTTIVAKCIVFYLNLTTILHKTKGSFSIYILKTIASIFFLVALIPLMIILVLIGHVSLLWNIGSSDDCLGYTIIVEK